MTNERRLRFFFIFFAIGLGLVHAWAGRHAMNPDGISYLDMGDAFLRKDWTMAINAYWSPLYAWLLGFTRSLIQPSLYWEFPVVHVVNFFIFVFALIAFHFFLESLITFLARYREDDEKDGMVRLSPHAFIAIGYSLFLVITLNFITLANVSPDLLVAVCLFVAGGLLLFIANNQKKFSIAPFVLLGIALGVGYLAKAIMFPLAFVILFTALIAKRMSWKHSIGVFVACAIFLFLSTPWILAISRVKGRLTFGESSILTYAWHVNGVRLHTHWQGEEGIFGAPVHPSRILRKEPSVYAFGEPVGGAYAPWYDPSYWYEGLQFSFDLHKQLLALQRNARLFYETLVTFQVWSVAAGFMIATFLWRHALRLREVVRMSILFLPAAAGFSTYLFVLIQPRYIAPFVIFFFLAWASLIRLPHNDHNKHVAHSIIGVATLLLLLPLLVSTGSKFVHADTRAHAETAAALLRAGIHAGDAVAVIGWQFDGSAAYWAYLAHVRIVAESATTEKNFWMADRAVQQEVLSLFQSTGAKAVVTEGGIPSYADISAWEPLGVTGRYLFLLNDDMLRAFKSVENP